MLGKPSMKTVKNYSGGAAEKAELRASRSKTEHRRATEPMLGSRRRIPSSTHVTEDTANERVKRKSWQHKRSTVLCRADVMIYNKKQKSSTKWQSEVEISKRKYVDKKDQQWWWGALINAIMQWNHNIIIYQCWKWSNWAKLIAQNMMWSALNQRWLIGGNRSHEYNEVNFFSSTQNRWKGGHLTRKGKQNYCQCDVTLPDCVGSP